MRDHRDPRKQLRIHDVFATQRAKLAMPGGDGALAHADATPDDSGELLLCGPCQPGKDSSRTSQTTECSNGNAVLGDGLGFLEEELVSKNYPADVEGGGNCSNQPHQKHVGKCMRGFHWETEEGRQRCLKIISDSNPDKDASQMTSEWWTHRVSSRVSKLLVVCLTCEQTCASSSIGNFLRTGRFHCKCNQRRRVEAYQRTMQAKGPEWRSERAKKGNDTKGLAGRKEAARKRLQTYTSERMAAVHRRRWRGYSENKRATISTNVRLGHANRTAEQKEFSEHQRQETLGEEGRETAARRRLLSMGKEGLVRASQKRKKTISSFTPERWKAINKKQRLAMGPFKLQRAMVRRLQTMTRERRQAAAQKRLITLTPERRKEATRKGQKTMTTEKRKASAKRRADTYASFSSQKVQEIAQKRLTTFTPVRRRVAKRKAQATLGPEGRSQAAAKGRANMGAERRREAARKAEITKGRSCESEACQALPGPMRGIGRWKSKKWGKVCWDCLGRLDPDRTKRKVRREHLIVAEIQRLLPELEVYADEWVWDCPFPGGCSLKKPDLLYRMPAHNLYIQFEIDENGHSRYQCLDEDARLEIIAADVGMPGTVLRINPDGSPKMLEKIKTITGEQLWVASKHFASAMIRVADFVRDQLQLIQHIPNTISRYYFDASMEAPCVPSVAYARHTLS